MSAEPQAPDPSPAPKPRQRFRRASRLSGKKAFAAVFDAKMRKHAGPLAVLTRPNGLGFHRLGLSVSRKVGKAVVRNRVKRRLREAFRLDRPTHADYDTRDADGDLVGYDIVVVVRPGGADAPLCDLRGWLCDALRQSHANWRRRLRPRPTGEATRANDAPRDGSAPGTSENPPNPG